MEAGTCPVCGGYVPAESEYIRRKRNASKGFWQDSWDNLWENRAELFGWTPAGARFVIIVLAATAGMFIYILMTGE